MLEDIFGGLGGATTGMQSDMWGGLDTSPDSFNQDFIRMSNLGDSGSTGLFSGFNDIPVSPNDGGFNWGDVGGWFGDIAKLGTNLATGLVGNGRDNQGILQQLSGLGKQLGWVQPTQQPPQQQIMGINSSTLLIGAAILITVILVARK